MNIALILSGGAGTRLCAEIPKQYIKVGGQPILCYCIKTLSKHEDVGAIQIVADIAWHALILDWMKTVDKKKKIHGFSIPGSNRQLSILHGLEDIRSYAKDCDYVLVHDAARPLLSPGQITDCLEKVKGHDGLMPVLPMKDTVYTSVDGGKHVAELLDRSTIYAGQAPEVFRIGRYYDANLKLLPDRIRAINGSTEPAVLDGMDIVMIPGDEGNFKITTQEDLERFCRIVDERGKCQEKRYQAAISERSIL